MSADSIGFWPIVSVSADSQDSTIGRPLETTLQKNYSGCEQILKYLNFPHFLTGKHSGEKVWEIQIL